MKRLTFTANGGGDCIGGSSYRYYKEIVIDHGAIQRGKQITYPEVPEGDIPLFFLSHCHLDHCGGVPIFSREHPETKFLMTKTTAHGMELQLRDSIKIAGFQARVEYLKGRRPTPLPFDHLMVTELMRRIEYVSDTSWFEPLPGYKMSCRSAGHMPGAKIFLIVFPDGTKVIHACDISFDEQALVRGAAIPSDFLNPDVLVIECTYGNREIPERAVEEQRLIATVAEIFQRDGKIIVPHFASTLANIALPLARAGFPTYIDGMGRDFTEHYAAREPWCEQDKPFDLSLLNFVDMDPRDAQNHREELVMQSSPMVVVSSSGMLEAGPSVYFVEAAIENPNNAVVVPGYQANETQGRKLLQLARGERITFSHQRIVKGNDGREHLKEWTETREIRAEILPFKLSGHSGGKKVAEWIHALNPRTVITVHGDPESHEGLRERVKRLNRNIEVIASKNSETIEFSFLS